MPQPNSGPRSPPRNGADGDTADREQEDHPPKQSVMGQEAKAQDEEEAAMERGRSQ